ncbi:MAG: hypothetical protein WC356_01735 [Candidatus Micrarchaeia archaeon]
MHVVACTHPFKLANQEFSLSPALSLTQILAEVQPDALLRRRAHVWVNDKYMAPELWDNTYPAPGSEIAIRVVPSGGGVGRIVGTVFLAIAVIAVAALVTWMIGPAAYPILAPMMGSLAGGIVGVVGNLALNALFPPVQPGGAGTLTALSAMPGLTGVDYGQSSPTLSITGAQNKANLWGPVPFILGKFRVAPFYGARTYTESAGGKQWLRILVIWGFAPVQVEDLRILDTALENYPGIEVEHRNLTLLVSNQTIAINVSARTLTRTEGNWLVDGIKAGDTVTLGGCTTAANDTGYLTTNVTELVLTYSTGTATTTEAGNGAQTASITWGDDPLTLYAVDIQEKALSIELEQNVENIDTSDLDADELSIDIACNSLMGLTAGGGTYNFTVIFTVAYRETGTSGGWLTPNGTDGDGNAATAIAMTGNTKSQVRGNLRWKVPARGQYDIKVVRTTAPDTIWTSSVSYWVALRTITNEDPIGFPHPLAKTAMRIQATGRLNGTVEEFKGTLTSICPDWDAETETWITRPTQNPASLKRLVLQGPQNQKPLADSRIDLLNLQYWHEYCETQGWKYHKYIDYNCTVEELIKEIAAAARSAYTRIDSKVGVIIDEPKPFVTGPAFTPRNILKDSFQSTVTIVERPHAFRCPFINEGMQYQQDERIIPSDGYLINGKDTWGVTQVVGEPFSPTQNYAEAAIFEQLDLPGVTDPELIFRHTRYHDAVARLRGFESVQFGTDIEWLVATRGDRTKVGHDVMLSGLSWGRVKSVVMEIIGYEIKNKYGGGIKYGSGAKYGEPDLTKPIYSGPVGGVTVDEILPMEAGKDYVLRFRLSDNTSLLCPIVTDAGEVKTVTFVTPVDPAEFNLLPGDLFLFGEAGLEANDLLIKSIQPNSDLSATVVTVPYDENIYLADVGAIPNHDPKISIPAAWSAPLIGDIRSDGSVLFPIPGGGWQSRILVTLVRPSGLDHQITGVEGQFWVTGSGEAALTLPVVSLDVGEVSILPVTDGQSYDFRLRYVKKDGSRGPWCTTETHVVEGKTADPSDVTGFIVMQMENQIEAEWTLVPDKDVPTYEIRYGEVGIDWDYAAVVNGKYSGSTFNTTKVPFGTWDFLIKAIDTSGNYSATAARVTLQVYQFYTIISQTQQAPLWAGTLINCVRNPQTGNINPSMQPATIDDYFDCLFGYCHNPYEEYSYETPEIDLGSDETARLWARIQSNLGPGETGNKPPQLSVDYKLTAGAYDGFEDWSIGYLQARYVKSKIAHQAADGLRRITGFQPVIDQAA